MNAVVTAGGRLDPAYALIARTPIKALAEVRGVTMLDRTLAALRGVGVGRIAVVGGTEVRAACGHRVERFIDESAQGSQNVLRALHAWDDDAGLLYVTSDMPYVTPEALADFIRRARPDSLSLPLVEHDAYVSRFPDAPHAGITLAGSRVVNGGAFWFPPNSTRSVASFAMRLFDVRKVPWRMATIVGLRFAIDFARHRVSIASLEAHASRLLECRAIAVRNAAPELGFDADSAEDYRYARERS